MPHPRSEELISRPPDPAARLCAVCRADISFARRDSRTCGPTCRQRLRRRGALSRELLAPDVDRNRCRCIGGAIPIADLDGPRCLKCGRAWVPAARPGVGAIVLCLRPRHWPVSAAPLELAA